MRVKRNLKISRTWSFDEKVSKVFDSHVNQSIPLYKEFHEQIASISEFYCKDNSVIYDLGCSTGNFIKEISRIKKMKLSNKNTILIRTGQIKVKLKYLGGTI